MKYRDGYRYQLAIAESFNTDIRVPANINTEFIVLSTEGMLIIKAGYAWDGPSGPTVDTQSFMRGSLAHDALYQLMRMERLDIKWRIHADKELVKICKVDGMWGFRRWYVERELRKFGAAAADPKNKKKLFTAP